MILISLLIALFTAQVYEVDPRLERYVDDYFEILKENNVKIPPQVRFMVKIHKESLPRDAAGAAWGMFKPYMVMIAVDPNALFLSHNQLRWLLFHELTHDIWDIRHESGLKIMRPVMPDYVSGYEVNEAMCELIQVLPKNK